MLLLTCSYALLVKVIQSVIYTTECCRHEVVYMYTVETETDNQLVPWDIPTRVRSTCHVAGYKKRTVCS